VPTVRKPALWHIRISHYSEKARWALDHKRVEYERHAPMPSAHMPVALWLTRGRHKTFPVLELDGRAIGDSTAIIAALEERYPNGRLYPEDPVERARALELEDFFDEELGPYMRRIGWYELAQDRPLLAKMVEADVPAPLRRLPGSQVMLSTYAAAFTRIRYTAGDDDAAEQARVKVRAALDRLEAELGDNEYLVGEEFTVADLTAASLFYPLVLPPEGPSSPGSAPGLQERLRGPLMDRPGYEWVARMFARHRLPAGDPVPA
jgi:glutathione S-transferase